MPSFDRGVNHDVVAAGHGMLAPIFIILALWLCLNAWFFQKSLEKYWQYAWRQPYPLSFLAQYPAWRFGGELADATQAFNAHVGSSLRVAGHAWRGTVCQTAANAGMALADVWCGAEEAASAGGAEQLVEAPLASVSASDEESPLSVTLVAPAVLAAAPAPTPLAADESPPPDTLRLKRGQKVLFVGDSLMQGVAPHMQQALLKHWKIHSVNLSRHSTGLAYPAFFNWPEAVRQAFAKHPDIGVMVVLLGANDLRGMSHPKGGAILRFGSPEWESVYRARIRDMTAVATRHGAQVLWLQLPNMRNTRMNSSAHFLNTLYESETRQARGAYQKVNEVLGMSGDTYAEHATDPELQRTVKVRVGDGVHMTVRGYKMVARAALARLELVDEAP